MQPTKLTEAFIKGLTNGDRLSIVRNTVVRGLMVAVNKHTTSYKVQSDLWVGVRGRPHKVKTVHE